MEKLPQYLLILFLVFGSFYGIKYYQSNFVPKTLSNEIERPDVFLDNSRIFVKEHAYDRSLKQLEMAIKAMKDIEGDLDDESNVLIEEAIAELNVILDEFRNYEINVDDMNHAYSKALNVLTLAELRVTEALIEHEESDKARVALKYGMFHLKNALQYTNGTKKQYEAHIYDEIDSLLDNKNIPKEQLIGRLEFMIGELDSLVHDKVN